MNYTKGEWKHFEDGVILASDGRQIASVFPRDREANANLIVAAADMYEACLSALGVMATLDQNKGWVKEISKIIQEALAKAEGK